MSAPGASTPGTSPTTDLPVEGAILIMQPSELQQKWNLTNTQLAIALGKTEETIKAYKSRSDARSHRNAPQSTIILCQLLDKEWERVGTVQIQLIAA